MAGVLALLLGTAACGPAKRVQKRPLASQPASPRAPEPADSPGEAMEYEWERRSVDGAPLDARRYQAAKRAMARMPVQRPRGARAKGVAPELSVGSWEQLGPANIGGRTRSLLMHPTDFNILYTTGINGGIWKSTDGGQSWRALNDFLPVLVISSLVMDPRDPNTLYAGTGDGFLGFNAARGAGIFKTTDGGETWTWLESTANDRFWFVNDLVISPHDSQRIYAATNVGILRSGDGGQSWNVVFERGLPRRGCHDLAIRTDVATDFLLAACGIPLVRVSGALMNKDQPGEDGTLPASIFQNKDAANSPAWTEVFSDADMGRTALAFAPSNQNIVYASVSGYAPGPFQYALLGVFRSDSGGDAGSWRAQVRNDSPRRINRLLLSNPLVAACQQSASFSGQAWHDNILGVDPVNPEVVWLGGVDWFRSDDGGQNWGIASFWWAPPAQPQYAHADQHAILFHPQYNGTTNQTMYIGSDGGIFRTDNARGNVPTSDTAPCNPAGGGVFWRALNTDLVTMQFYHGSVYPGGQHYFGGSQDNGTARGSQAAAGRQWTAIGGGDGATTAIDAVDANNIWISSQNFNLARSVDGVNFVGARNGITEPSGNFTFIAPLAMDPSDSRVLWAGGNTLWRSTNGAASWTAASGVLTARSFSTFAIAPGNPNAVMAGTRTGEIFRSSNAREARTNADWSQSKARNGWVSALAFEPGNAQVVYAVYSSFNREPGDGHVYKSTDGGATWTLSDGEGATALPDQPYHSIALHPEKVGTIYLAGDLGLFVSEDAGRTWARVDEEFPFVPTNHLHLRKDSGVWTLYAFTHGRGLWRTRLGGTVNCRYQLSPPGSVNFTAAGGVEARTIETTAECEWSVVSETPWARVISAASGTGTRAIRIQVEANTSTSQARSGRLWIADQAVGLAQSPNTLSAAGDEPGTAAALGDLPAAVTVDSRSATSGVLDPTHSCTQSRDARTVWFRHQATAAGAIAVSAVVEGTGTGGTVVAVYPDGNPPGAELACAAAGAGVAARTSFDVEAGRSYLVQVASAGLAANGGLVTVGLSRGLPLLDAVPSRLDFGTAPVGRTVEQRLIVKNAGNTPQLVPAAAFSHPAFAWVSDPGAFTLAPGAQRELVVRLRATAAGSLEATLTLGSLRIPLAATVVPEAGPDRIR
jgi:hypothetical protein